MHKAARIDSWTHTHTHTHTVKQTNAHNPLSFNSREQTATFICGLVGERQRKGKVRMIRLGQREEAGNEEEEEWGEREANER